MQDDKVFAALSNPIRRALLLRLLDGPATPGALAEGVDAARSSVSEHLGVLRRAGLVAETVQGRERLYRLQPAPFTAVGDWLQPFEAYWSDRLADLKTALEPDP